MARDGLIRRIVPGRYGAGKASDGWWRTAFSPTWGTSGPSHPEHLLFPGGSHYGVISIAVTAQEHPQLYSQTSHCLSSHSLRISQASCSH